MIEFNNTQDHYTQMQQVSHGADDDDTVVVDVYNGADDNIDATS